MDLALQGVHEEDRPVVRNVIRAIEVIKAEKLFTSWTCTVHKGFYIITAYMADGDWELGLKEIELVQEVNPLRVVSVSVQYHGGRHGLRVKISDKAEPLMLTETQIVHIRKRSRWLNH